METERKNLLIRVRNISVVYERRRALLNKDPLTALQNVSLDLFAGESLGVVGRNGVGKTTLLRVLANIISPDSGTVENFGASTAMLSLQVGFDPLATGRTNILLSSLLLGYTKNEIDERMDEIIAFSELGGFIDQPLAGYSAGMRARLGFSICYFMKPDILLIDEALGVGDIEFRQKSAKAMAQKIRSEQTVVLVSHSSNTIKNLCTRALWIEDGMSKMEGDTDAVIHAYEKYVGTHPRA
ncbi:MAG: ATP-binding cassette domain-containing protein [Gammaproteobacteria bacterium]|nr:ATP-binding cassette domain-containing protein [Gammaproteobacteria bacterium]